MAGPRSRVSVRTQMGVGPKEHLVGQETLMSETTWGLVKVIPLRHGVSSRISTDRRSHTQCFFQLGFGQEL